MLLATGKESAKADASRIEMKNSTTISMFAEITMRRCFVVWVSLSEMFQFFWQKQRQFEKHIEKQFS